MAATVLHRDPLRARTSASSLLEHLDSVAPHRRTAFEKHLVEEDGLYESLQAFTTRAVPVCVWQGGGAYRTLFQFLALRFLLAPDHVLDCERIHGRWNWLGLCKRSLRLPLLNAWLRLRQHLEDHGMEFPAHEGLLAHLVQEATAMRVACAEVEAMEDVAPGYRAAFVMLERFNLRTADVALAMDDPGGVPAVVHGKTDFESTGSVYLRNTFLPRRFYHAPSLGRGDVWFFVLENKVLAGREKRHEGDAQTRPLVVCFFERTEGAPGELTVSRMDQQFSGMTTLTLTPAELALHLGFVLPLDVERSAAEMEALVERMWLETPRLGYEHKQLAEEDDLHTYTLAEPLDAEDVFWDSCPSEEHTKYALARHLERRHGWDRERLWKRSLGELRVAAGAGIPPWVAVAVGVPGGAVPAAGRGRARGRAGGGRRGRGRGGGP